MKGEILKWDVLMNSRTVIQGWGWRKFIWALWGRYPTFLALCELEVTK